MAAPFIPLCSLLEVEGVTFRKLGLQGVNHLPKVVQPRRGGAQVQPRLSARYPSRALVLGTASRMQHPLPRRAARGMCPWTLGCALSPSQSLWLSLIFPPRTPQPLSDAWSPKAGFSAQTSWFSSLLQDNP